MVAHSAVVFQFEPSSNVIKLTKQRLRLSCIILSFACI